MNEKLSIKVSAAWAWESAAQSLRTIDHHSTILPAIVYPFARPSREAQAWKGPPSARCTSFSAPASRLGIPLAALHSKLRTGSRPPTGTEAPTPTPLKASVAHRISSLLPSSPHRVLTCIRNTSEEHPRVGRPHTHKIYCPAAPFANRLYPRLHTAGFVSQPAAVATLRRSSLPYLSHQLFLTSSQPPRHDSPTILALFTHNPFLKGLPSSPCSFRYYNLVVLRGTPFPATGTTTQYLITRTKQHTQPLPFLSSRFPNALQSETNNSSIYLRFHNYYYIALLFGIVLLASSISGLHSNASRIPARHRPSSHDTKRKRPFWDAGNSVHLNRTDQHRISHVRR
jgi:hypothetical protein